MNRVLYCLTDHHDLKLVVLAALVCLLSCSVVMVVLDRAQNVQGGMSRLRWIATAGIAGGFGIFATHFIAMLAFDPGLHLTFDARITLVSALAAMAITAGGAEIATSRAFPGASLVGGAVIGAGVGVMHYLGMMSVSFDGRIAWSGDLVVASVVAGLILGAASLGVFALRRTWSSAAATVLLVLAIVAHHFTGMGAVTVIRDAQHHASGFALSPASMSITLAVAAIGVLTLCMAAVRSGNRIDSVKAESNRRFGLLLEGVTDYGIFMLNPDGIVTHWNGGAARINGFTADEMIGNSFSAVVGMDAQTARQHLEGQRRARETGRFEIEFRSHRKDGTPYWGHSVVTPLYDEHGALLGYAYATQDMTVQKADKERILDISRNLDAALSHMSQGLCLFDRNERLILANGRFSEIYGLDPAAVQPGIAFRDLLSDIIVLSAGTAPSEDRLEAEHARHRAIIAQSGGGGLVSELFPDRPMAISHRPMPNGGWVTTLDDISEQRRAEQRIAHMTRHDDLTGLPNRAHFSQHLDHELSLAARNNEQVAVTVIDLSRFKELNDQRGHSIGDAALKILGERLASLAFGDRRFVARLGGDEFGAVRRFEAGEGEDAIRTSMEKLQACITEPMLIAGSEISLAAAFGAAIFPGHGGLREQLVNNADLALARAKAQGSDTVCLYEPEMDEAARERRTLAKDLVRALDNGEFRVFYQVQQAVMTGKITGYEALIRWKHPHRGFVSPADFIAVAEESGSIVDIGAWVLRTACYEAVRWNNDARIAVNLSPVQLKDVDLINTVRSVLAETGLSPHRLELEITESTIIEDKITALHILRQIKSLGVTIAIDDFGTGYASLDTLNAFPFDKIKIDRSFLRDADTSRQARAIVRAILALGRSLEIPVLAEGVETEEQLALLQEEGCEEAQGYLLGRPAEQVSMAALRQVS